MDGIINKHEEMETLTTETFLKVTPLIKDLIWIIIEYFGREPNIQGEIDIIIGAIRYKNICKKIPKHIEDGPVRFCHPEGIATDGINLYVSDSSGNDIEVIDPNGKYIMSCGTRGTEKGNFNGPCGLVIHNSQLYVADTGNKRIQIFSIPDMKFINELYLPFYPYKLSIYKSYLYICTWEKNSIFVYTLHGTLSHKINLNGVCPNRYMSCSRMSSLSVTENDIYIAIAGCCTILCVTREGKYKFHSNGKIHGGRCFDNPQSIFVTDLMVYVGDRSGIQQFDIQNFGFIKEFGNGLCAGISDMLFFNNKCYTSDWQHGCIFIFR